VSLRFRCRIFAAGLLIAWPAMAILAIEFAFESSARAARHRRAIERSRELLRGVLELYPGTTVAVGHDDEIVWSAGFGYADVQRKIPVSAATQFRIGRVSETLTAAAAARLQEEGRLDLDAPVSRYVPSFPEKGFVLTSRQLGGHMAGLRAPPDDQDPGRRHCTQLEDALNAFVREPLLRAPGTQFLHSSYGYVLLSAVLAAASGQDFFTCIQEEILRPARMTATVLEDPRSKSLRLSQFYERGWLGMLRPARPMDTSCQWGAAGFLSTAEDLVRFGMALLRGDIVHKEALAVLFSPQRTKSGGNTGQGLGWQISPDSRGRLRYLQSGRTVGGRSAIVLVPEHGLAVTLLANIDGEHLDDHANRIASFFLEPE